MKLVMVLPSAEDEVNVACFHPFPGGGLVYGTKVWFCLLTLKFTWYYIINDTTILVVGRKA